ncbi:MAG TPA: hypothetical protein VES20_12475, partial [Bryobacteraceae bacterium]|nr:hypothetical protein [Bryobacteraceae bacterium]
STEPSVAWYSDHLRQENSLRRFIRTAQETECSKVPRPYINKPGFNLRPHTTDRGSVTRHTEGRAITSDRPS